MGLRIVPALLVGRDLRVLWPEEDAWFLGRVTEYLPETGQHKVCVLSGTA